MIEKGKWLLNQDIQGHLVAMDVVGYGRRSVPDGLLHARMDLFHAVEESELFPNALQTGDVKIHFRGDEIRLGFTPSINARQIIDFIDQVRNTLMTLNRNSPPDAVTLIRGIALAGIIKWKCWHGASFLDGPLTNMCIQWMPLLDPGEIALNEALMQSLRAEGFPQSKCYTRKFANECGYVLGKGISK